MNFELLAPAGSPEKMKFAFAYGADACYMGMPDFSLRTRLNNFNFNSLKASIDFAHSIGKKIYVTFNIFAHNQHLDRFEELKAEFTDFLNGPSRPDAVIVSDPGLMLAIHEVAPNIDIHVSTQANTLNYKAVQFWEKNGATRAILGREASLDDIRAIRKHCPNIEIECFVHGAMCMAYSGRCFLSRYFTGASANLGACAQPCRREYSYEGERINEDGEKEVILMEDEHGSYFFNSHDLCSIEYIRELMEAGVTSFKVEGRTKSIFYVSMVMKAYREVMDSVTNNTYSPEDVAYWKNELNKLINRGYSTGFMFGEAIQDPSLE
jgi:putative protease